MEALTAGVSALGVPIDGRRSRPDPVTARAVLRKAVAADPRLADGWLALIAAGDRGVDVLAGLHAAKDRVGEGFERIRVQATALDTSTAVADIMIDNLFHPGAITAAYAVRLVEEGRFDEADRALAGEPADDYTVYARVVLAMRTERWTDVLAATDRSALVSSADPYVGKLLTELRLHAQARVGLFSELLDSEVGRRRPAPDLSEAVRATGLYYRAMAARATGDGALAESLLREALAVLPGFSGAQDALDDPSLGLVVVNPARISERADRWDPATQPTEEERIAVKAAAGAADSLAKAQAELDAMVGLEDVKQQVEDLSDRAMVLAYRRDELKEELDDPEDSQHVLLVGPPGTGKTEVGRLLSGFFYGHGLLPTDKFIETSRAKLIGNVLGDTEKATQAVLEEADGGTIFFDEFHDLYEQGYHKGDAFGNAIVNTLLPVMENARANLIVIAAGYNGAIEEVLDVNEGLRGRFAQRVTFRSYNSVELSGIADLMCERRSTSIDPDAHETMRRYYEALGKFEALNKRGVQATGTDLVGNARFVRQWTRQANKLLQRQTAQMLKAGSRPSREEVRTLTPPIVEEALRSTILDTVRPEHAEGILNLAGG